MIVRMSELCPGQSTNVNISSLLLSLISSGASKVNAEKPKSNVIPLKKSLKI